MPNFICPNCKRRVVDDDRRDGLTHQPVGCPHCSFGFLFEILDDYYPSPNTAFVVCNRNRRIIATGRGLFELTGFQERELIGQDVMEAFGMNGAIDPDPSELAVEYGVRRMGQQLPLRTKAGIEKKVTVDFFPAYDEDGGLLVAIRPRRRQTAKATS